MGVAIITPHPGGPMRPPRPPAKGGAMPPSLSPPKPPADDAPDKAADGGKVSHEDCLFIPANMHCGSCANYSPEDGSCAKVVGTMDPDDLCIRYFKSLGDGEDNDNDVNAEPDLDADDTGDGSPSPTSMGAG